MSTTPALEQALEAFAQTFSESNVFDETAGQMTCREANTFAHLLTQLGAADAAEELLRLHKISDEEGNDEHYEWA